MQTRIRLYLLLGSLCGAALLLGALLFVQSIAARETQLPGALLRPSHIISLAAFALLVFLAAGTLVIMYIQSMHRSLESQMTELAVVSDDARRFGAIVAIADAGFIVKDEHGVVQSWNIGAENILGYRPEEIIGRTTKYYSPSYMHAGIDDIESRLAQGEHIAHVEVVRSHKDGRAIDCSASYTPIMDDKGRFTGSVAIFHDISDKKRIEKELHEALIAAEQASRAKSSFLANMSHEIRTPINGVLGFTELALDDAGLPQNLRDYLQKIRLSADSMLDIISNILDLSKIEAGKTELELIPFSLHDVFRQCVTMSGVRAKEKGIVLYFHSEPYVGKKFLGDPTRLRQVLLNLLSNAIKFTHKGTVKLLSHAEYIDNGKMRVSFEVKDSGIGMSKEQLDKVFEPFTQADSSTTREFGGTGLGLTITKSMIELMGGKLTAESLPGVGSKFSFTLIFAVCDGPESAPLPDEPEHIEKPIFSGDVLVCEDNEINHQVIREHLSRVGLTVTIAENGEQGVRAVTQRNANGRPFDLIFMDIHMPVTDGLEASRRLDEIGNQTPVIALTANAMVKDRETYLAHGMSDFLAKPFKARELWACLLKYLVPIGSAAAPGETSDSGFDNVTASAAQIGVSVIDRQLGLEQCGEDEELYNGLLARFVSDYKTIYEEIESAISRGDTTFAHSIAHTLKGVSGTLGAAALSAAAREVESALKNGSVEESLLLELRSELSTVLTELESLRDETAKNTHSSTILDVCRAQELIARLAPLLESYDSRCLELLGETRQTLAPFGESCTRLIKCMEVCDFEAAFAALEEIRLILL